MLDHVVSAAKNLLQQRHEDTKSFFSVCLICPAPNLFICILFWPRRHKELL